MLLIIVFSHCTISNETSGNGLETPNTLHGVAEIGNSDEALTNAQIFLLQDTNFILLKQANAPLTTIVDSTITDDNGHYTFSDIGLGSFEIYGKSEDSKWALYNTLTVSTSKTLDTLMSYAVPSVTLSGTLPTADSSYIIDLINTPYTVTVLEEHSFEIHGIYPAQYTVEVFYSQDRDSSQELQSPLLFNDTVSVLSNTSIEVPVLDPLNPQDPLENTTQTELDSTIRSSTPSSRLSMGAFTLVNNTWGSDAIGCDTEYEIFVETNSQFGWEFERGNCQDNFESPDFPTVEFGASPFNGLTKSTTDLLPIQIKDITSASIIVDSLHLALEKVGVWNISFGLWLTKNDPTQSSSPEPQLNLMVLWGWQNGRWPCDVAYRASEFNDQLTIDAGDQSYTLCHHSNAIGSQNYIEFDANSGPQTTLNERLDIAEIVLWTIENAGYSDEYWLSRVEVGTEIGDNSSGTVTIQNITVEVNGDSKSVDVSSGF